MIHLEQKQKIYKSFLFFLSFTCFMIFAGLLSAYLVSSQDVYWIITPAPFWLYLSLVILLLSSGTFILSVKAIKKNKSKQSLSWLILTFLLALVFIYGQIQGYLDLSRRGFAMSSPIISKESKIDLEINGKKISFYFNIFDQLLYSSALFLPENALTQIPLKSDQNLRLSGAFIEEKLGIEYIDLIFKKQLLYLPNDSIHPIFPKKITAAGILIPEGEYGKDFWIQKQKKKLIEYQGQFFEVDDLYLNDPLGSKISAFQNNASAYLFVLIILHAGHVVIALLAFFYLMIGLLKKKYNAQNYFGIAAASGFWHFLGGLWLVLFLFLFYFYPLNLL